MMMPESMKFVFLYLKYRIEYLVVGFENYFFVILMFEHKLLKIDRYQSVYVQKMTQVDDFCYNLWLNLFSNEYEECTNFLLLDL